MKNKTWKILGSNESRQTIAANKNLCKKVVAQRAVQHRMKHTKLCFVILNVFHLRFLQLFCFLGELTVPKYVTRTSIEEGPGKREAVSFPILYQRSCIMSHCFGDSCPIFLQN